MSTKGRRNSDIFIAPSARVLASSTVACRERWNDQNQALCRRRKAAFWLGVAVGLPDCRYASTSERFKDRFHSKSGVRSPFGRVTSTSPSMFKRIDWARCPPSANTKRDVMFGFAAIATKSLPSCPTSSS